MRSVLTGGHPPDRMSPPARSAPAGPTGGVAAPAGAVAARRRLVDGFGLERLVRGGGHRVPLGRGGRTERCDLVCLRARDEQAGERPDETADDDPHPGPEREADDHPDRRSDGGGDELTPAGDQADAQTGHRGREDDIEPEPGRIGELAAEHHPGERRQVPRDEGRHDGPDPVAAIVGAADPLEVSDRQREGLVGQEVSHQRARPRRTVAEPRCEGRRIEQMASVEQRGQDDDPRPGQSAGDVADRGELGGAGEHEDAHRHRLDRRESGAARGQSIDEPEPGGRHGDAGRLLPELAARRRDVGRRRRDRGRHPGMVPRVGLPR